MSRAQPCQRRLTMRPPPGPPSSRAAQSASDGRDNPNHRALAEYAHCTPDSSAKRLRIPASPFADGMPIGRSFHLCSQIGQPNPAISPGCSSILARRGVAPAAAANSPRPSLTRRSQPPGLALVSPGLSRPTRPTRGDGVLSGAVFGSDGAIVRACERGTASVERSEVNMCFKNCRLHLMRRNGLRAVGMRVGTWAVRLIGRWRLLSFESAQAGGAIREGAYRRHDKPRPAGPRRSPPPLFDSRRAGQRVSLPPESPRRRRADRRRASAQLSRGGAERDAPSAQMHGRYYR